MEVQGKLNFIFRLLSRSAFRVIFFLADAGRVSTQLLSQWCPRKVTPHLFQTRNSCRYDQLTGKVKWGVMETAASHSSLCCSRSGWETASFPGKSSPVLRCCFSFQLDCDLQLEISVSLFLTQRRGKNGPRSLCMQPLPVILSHLLQLLFFFFSPA